MDEATVQRPQAAKTYGLLPEVSLEFRATGISWISSAVPAHRRASSHSSTGQPSGWEAKERILHGLFSFLALVPKTQQSNREEDRENAKRGVYRSYSLRQKLEIVHYARSTVRKIRDDDIFYRSLTSNLLRLTLLIIRHLRLPVAILQFYFQLFRRGARIVNFNMLNF